MAIYNKDIEAKIQKQRSNPFDQYIAKLEAVSDEIGSLIDDVGDDGEYHLLSAQNYIDATIDNLKLVGKIKRRKRKVMK